MGADGVGGVGKVAGSGGKAVPKEERMTREGKRNGEQGRAAE